MGARIATVEVFPLSHPLSRSRGVSCAWYDRRECILVRVADDDGLAGWGEAAARPGVRGALMELRGSLVGSDPSMPRAVLAPLTAMGIDAWALSALAIALDDLRARQLGVAIAALHGGMLRTTARAYGSSGGYALDEEPEVLWPREVDDAVAAGMTAVKLRIGRHGPARELPILARLRAEWPSIDLLVDANGAYALPTALAVGRQLERLGIGWYEEPLWRVGGGLSYPGYADLTGALDIPVAAGEALETRDAFATFIERRGAQIVQPDVGICGGIGEALFVAETAALHGRSCVPHCWGGAVLQAATLQLIAVLPPTSEVADAGLPLFELDMLENTLATSIAAPLPLDERGCVTIPTGPGLGIDIDEERVRRTSIESCGAQR